MDAVISDLSASENVVLVHFAKDTDFSGNLKKFSVHKSIYSEELESATHDSASVVLCCEIPDEKYTTEFLTHLLKVLNPGGKLLILNILEKEKVKFSLIMAGFMNVKISNGLITANKPKFELGSSTQLKLPKIPTSVWKLDTALDEESETIDPDELLDEDDLVKPDPMSLRVCGTTGKRKACKDCSCGLAEELSTEAQIGKIIDTTDAPKSSCGSCYLGDAFRCSSCPYLGMPAFKPGEKIQLLGHQLQADV
ncbi:unnamed protein product [Phaedon cochleariae]|uniref:Anamorsin homolog n=1 Tax=Phaedon cochleariae TaxID=80249 RepID=A0A9N9SII7_PHACE|nr:unnamed protein product [Phaedon cochleariae]